MHFLFLSLNDLEHFLCINITDVGSSSVLLFLFHMTFATFTDLRDIGNKVFWVARHCNSFVVEIKIDMK